MSKAKTISVDPAFRRDLYEQTMDICNDKDYKTRHKNETAVEALWEDAAKLAGKGVQINKLVKFTVADGYATYAIARIGGRSCTLVHLPFGDGYRSPAVTAGGSCPLSIVQTVVTCSDCFTAHEQKSEDEDARFFDSLEVGQFVHTEVTGAWMRNKVVMANYQWGEEKAYGKCLLPIAPVGTIRHLVNGKWTGDWNHYDIYKVFPSGKVTHGYHIEKIINGETFRCHASDIFEYTGKSHGINPTTAPVLPINPPPFTPEQLVTQQLWRDVNTVQKMLEQTKKEPLELMREVHAFISTLIP